MKKLIENLIIAFFVFMPITLFGGYIHADSATADRPAILENISEEDNGYLLKDCKENFEMKENRTSKLEMGAVFLVAGFFFVSYLFRKNNPSSVWVSQDKFYNNRYKRKIDYTGHLYHAAHFPCKKVHSSDYRLFWTKD